MTYKCDCLLAVTSGMPCVHITAVPVQYRCYTAAFPEIRNALEMRVLDIANCFNKYWLRDNASFVDSDEYRHCTLSVSQSTAQLDTAQSGHNEE